MLQILKRQSITLKVSILTLLITMIVWIILDYVQNQDIQQLFFTELSKELEKQAKEDRFFFDHHVQSHHQAARLIVSQQRFQEYVSGEAWLDNENIIHHYRLPSWMPKSSVMRAFFKARYAILIDSNGEVREIYHYFPDEIPPILLLDHENLRQKLSHNQSYMTMIENVPYVLATVHFEDADGEVLAALMLSSPIDSEFMMAAIEIIHSDQIVSLLEGEPLRVLASSNPDLLPVGTLINTLENRYVRTGLSFFDYGASDLKVQFASFIATEKAHRLANHILKKGHEQRAILTLALLISFFILILWIAYQIKILTRKIVTFSRDHLGIEPYQTGDEIVGIITSFQQLKNRIKSLIAQANAITAGDYKPKNVSAHDQLGRALSEMTQALCEAHQKSVMQDWLKTGRTQLNDQMRGKQETIELARNIITFLVSYLDAQVAMFYLASEQSLKLLATHGYQQRKCLANEYQLGEGLAGQAALEQEYILITEISENEVNIRHEEAAPQNVIAFPFRYEETKGVIEMWFLKPLTEVQLEFIEQVMEKL